MLFIIIAILCIIAVVAVNEAAAVFVIFAFIILLLLLLLFSSSSSFRIMIIIIVIIAAVIVVLIYAFSKKNLVITSAVSARFVHLFFASNLKKISPAVCSVLPVLTKSLSATPPTYWPKSVYADTGFELPPLLKK